MGFQPHGQPIVIVSLCCLIVVCELIFINDTVTVLHEQATEVSMSLGIVFLTYSW